MSKECYIVCGGPSLKDFNFSKLQGKDCIVTNKSIINVPWACYFVTIDFTFLRKMNAAYLRGPVTKVFIANFAPEYPYMKEIDGRIIDTRFQKVYDLSDFDMIIKSRKLDGLGKTFADFRSGENSGFCAFQLAVVLGYERINLLGVDLNTSEGETHYHGGYGGKEKFMKRLPNYVKFWRKGVNIALSRGVDVVSRSSISELNDIIPYEELSL